MLITYSNWELGDWAGAKPGGRICFSKIFQFLFDWKQALPSFSLTFSPLSLPLCVYVFLPHSGRILNKFGSCVLKCWQPGCTSFECCILFDEEDRNYNITAFGLCQIENHSTSQKKNKIIDLSISLLLTTNCKILNNCIGIWKHFHGHNHVWLERVTVQDEVWGTSRWYGGGWRRLRN